MGAHAPKHAQAAQDIRADPILWEACKDDAQSFCKDVRYGGGRVQACLVRACFCWALGEGGGRLQRST